MIYVLIFAIWAAHDTRGIPQAEQASSLFACQSARAVLLEEAAKRGLLVDARCISLNPGIKA